MHLSGVGYRREVEECKEEATDNYYADVADILEGDPVHLLNWGKIGMVTLARVPDGVMSEDDADEKLQASCASLNIRLKCNSCTSDKRSS